jgi:hypothetical protein
MLCFGRGRTRAPDLGKWRAWAPRHRERHQKDGHTRWRVTHALLKRAPFMVLCRELIPGLTGFVRLGSTQRMPALRLHRAASKHEGFQGLLQTLASMA